LLLGVGRPDAHGEDFVSEALFLDAECFLESDFVEGVDAHLDPLGDDARVVRLDPDADVLVHHTFDTDHDSAHALHSS